MWRIRFLCRVKETNKQEKGKEKAGNQPLTKEETRQSIQNTQMHTQFKSIVNRKIFITSVYS